MKHTCLSFLVCQVTVKDGSGSVGTCSAPSVREILPLCVQTNTHGLRLVSHMGLISAKPSGLAVCQARGEGDGSLQVQRDRCLKVTKQNLHTLFQ